MSGVVVAGLLMAGVWVVSSFVAASPERRAQVLVGLQLVQAVFAVGILVLVGAFIVFLVT